VAGALAVPGTLAVAGSGQASPAGHARHVIRIRLAERQAASRRTHPPPASPSGRRAGSPRPRYGIPNRGLRPRAETV